MKLCVFLLKKVTSRKLTQILRLQVSMYSWIKRLDDDEFREWKLTPLRLIPSIS